jgi:hypothetical protein
LGQQLQQGTDFFFIKYPDIVLAQQAAAYAFARL